MRLQGGSGLHELGGEDKHGGAPVLILTRRVGETVMIGDDITVTVLRVKGNQVRLGVNAPKSVSVQREEIFHRIKRENADGLADGLAVTEHASSATG